jgi:hypothetical protein
MQRIIFRRSRLLLPFFFSAEMIVFPTTILPSSATEGASKRAGTISLERNSLGGGGRKKLLDAAA